MQPHLQYQLTLTFDFIVQRGNARAIRAAFPGESEQPQYGAPQLHPSPHSMCAVLSCCEPYSFTTDRYGGVLGSGPPTPPSPKMYFRLFFVVVFLYLPFPFLVCLLFLTTIMNKGNRGVAASSLSLLTPEGAEDIFDF